MNIASTTWRPNPHATVRQRMARMSDEHAVTIRPKHAIPASARALPGMTVCHTNVIVASSTATPATIARSFHCGAPNG